MSDARAERLLGALGVEGVDPESREYLSALGDALVELVEHHEVEDLKVAATALTELARAASVFSPWRSRPKLTVYGSARTAPSSPLYQLAESLAAALRDRGWMTVAGGGPGIMEGAARGAGREHTLGVNIDLPFEQTSNPYVDADSRLVEMKYFFTRKVALTRESRAFAVLPGGLGTMDECFELLTLLHTGKTPPAPVVLLDEPTGVFWRHWRDFMERDVIDAGYLDPGDLVLVRLVSDVPTAVHEIEHFYRRYRDFERTAEGGLLRCDPPVSAEEVARLAAAHPHFDGGAMDTDTAGLRIAFDGRAYVALRRLIDDLNDL